MLVFWVVTGISWPKNLVIRCQKTRCIFETNCWTGSDRRSRFSGERICFVFGESHFESWPGRNVIKIEVALGSFSEYAVKEAVSFLEQTIHNTAISYSTGDKGIGINQETKTKRSVMNENKFSKCNDISQINMTLHVLVQEIGTSKNEINYVSILLLPRKF